MFGRIYLKLYFAFLIIFLVTTLTVVALSSGFYALRVRDEVESFFVSQARLLEDEYQQSCNESASEANCERFLKNVSHSGLLHLWILDPSGRVIRYLENRPPEI